MGEGEGGDGAAEDGGGTGEAVDLLMRMDVLEEWGSGVGGDITKMMGWAALGPRS